MSNPTNKTNPTPTTFTHLDWLTAAGQNLIALKVAPVGSTLQQRLCGVDMEVLKLTETTGQYTYTGDTFNIDDDYKRNFKAMHAEVNRRINS